MNFYYLPVSPPCQSVLLLAEAMRLNFNPIVLDFAKEEHKKPEFLKLNPQHTVPTLVDNDFVLWESRAILVYLCEKYGKKASLYPRDPKKRAVVNQRLYFELGTLSERLYKAYHPTGGNGQNADALAKLDECLGFLDGYLGKTAYVAGDNLTIADYPILVSITILESVVEHDLSPYQNIQRWYEELKGSVAGYERICVEGAKIFKQMFEAMKNGQQ